MGHPPDVVRTGVLRVEHNRPITVGNSLFEAVQSSVYTRPAVIGPGKIRIMHYYLVVVFQRLVVLARPVIIGGQFFAYIYVVRRHLHGLFGRLDRLVPPAGIFVFGRLIQPVLRVLGDKRGAGNK